MIRKIQLLILTLGISIAAFSQLEPLYSMYWNNYGTFNPAYSGLENDLDASLTRSKMTLPKNITWVGGGNLPSFWSFNVNAKLEDMNSGIGLFYINEREPFHITNKIGINYNYKINQNDHSLALGVSPGINILTTGIVNWRPPGETNGTVVEASPETKTRFSLNMGATYKYKDFIFGFSSTQINQPTLKDIYSLRRHLFFFSSYTLQFNDKIKLIPSLLYTKTRSYNDFRVNIRSEFYNLLWFGGGYNNNISLSAMAGVIIKGMVILGYSYEKYIGSTSFWGPTHEINVSFKLDYLSNSGNTN